MKKDLDKQGICVIGIAQCFSFNILDYACTVNERMYRLMWHTYYLCCKMFVNVTFAITIVHFINVKRCQLICHDCSNMWRHVTIAHLRIRAPVSVLVISLLRFCQLPLQTFFGGRASQFTPCVPPVAGPVVLGGVAAGGESKYLRTC